MVLPPKYKKKNNIVKQSQFTHAHELIVHDQQKNKQTNKTTRFRNKTKQWHALGREEQAKYYELARRERQLHMQMYPDWSSRTNASRGKKRKRKQDSNDGGISPQKKNHTSTHKHNRRTNKYLKNQKTNIKKNQHTDKTTNENYPDY